MKKIKQLLYSEAIRYLFFGGLATLVYFAFKVSSFLLTNSATISEIIAQLAAIIFAFFTNKIWVFEHQSSHLLKDFFIFALGRLGMLIFSTLVMWYLGDEHRQLLMSFFHQTSKNAILILSLILQVVIILVNYLYSKFFVFKK